MKYCNIKWANNKHWFNINQILHLISVETTSSIVLTLIHSKSIQHFIYIVPYKLCKIYPWGVFGAHLVWGRQFPISLFFRSFSFFLFFSSLSLLPYLHCTLRLFVPVPFTSLCFSWSSCSLHFVLRARRRECRARCKFVFWREKESSIVSFLCCCCWE